MRGVSRLFVRGPEEVAVVDATGGEIETVKWTDNGRRKVLLRLMKGGVTIEMGLTTREAEDLHTELLEALRWTRDGSAA